MQNQNKNTLKTWENNSSCDWKAALVLYIETVVHFKRIYRLSSSLSSKT
jgi:hypothetical protein